MDPEDKPGPSGAQASRGLMPRRGTGATPKSGRLPSIRTPRDLTLGGIRKKQFVPNIPVRKKKAEEIGEDNAAASVHKEPKKQANRREDSRGRGRGEHSRGRGRGEDSRGRGRGRGRGAPETIQSHSIFEQGPSERLNKGRGGAGLDSYDRSSSSSSSKVAVKKEKKEDPDTKRVIDNLLRDDFIDEKVKDPEPYLVPVRLPMGTAMKAELKSAVEAKPSIKVKEEPPDEFEPRRSAMEVDQKTSIKEDVQGSASSHQPRNCAELFQLCNKPEGELIFMQLPDVLPGHPPLTEEEMEGPHKKSGSKHEGATPGKAPDKADEVVQKLEQFSIADFSEGYIGKIQVHKSGKTTLVLGNVKLDVSLGMPAGFLQDVVSIHAEDDRQEMINLGHVQHKLVCTPDMDSLMSPR